MRPKSRRSKKAKKHNKFYRPMVEYLEDRTLMSASILGSVWNDLINDGVRAAAEPPVAAITVELRQGSSVIDAQTTNGAGNFAFAGLGAGLFTIAVLAPSGAVLRDVELGASDISGIDIGVQIPTEPPTNIDVTGDAAVQQMPSVAVNPLDSNHVVMAYMDYSLLGNGYAGIGVEVSRDGGAHWTRSSVPLPANFNDAGGQPVVRFDDEGHVYVSFMAAKFIGQGANGANLKPGVIFDLTTDTTAVGTNYLNKTVNRRIYGMQANNGVFVAKSSDDGLTWNAADIHAISSQLYDQSGTGTTTGNSAGGSATVTGIMPAGLYVGKALIIDEGLPTMGRATVTGFTGTTFTATFAKAYAAGTIKVTTPVFFDTIPDFAIDTNPSSPNYTKMYATWTRYYPASQFPGATTALSGSEIMFAVSTDNGVTWTTRYQDVSGVQFSAIKDPRTGGTGANTTVAAEGSGTNTFSRITVGAEGGVYVSFNAGGRNPIFYSSDAGATFRNPVPNDSDTMSDGYPFGVDSLEYTQIYPSGASVASFSPRSTLFNNFFRTLSARSIVADPARPGHVYAVEAVPIITTAGATIDSGEITFSRSTDFGVTWTPLFTVGVNTGNKDDLPAELQFRYRSAVNDDNATRFTGFEKTLADEVISGQALPQLGIDANGNLAIVWYDTRRDPNGKLLDVYSAVSTDGGQTFSPNARITTNNFNADAGAFRDARTFTTTSNTAITPGSRVITPLTMPQGLAANTTALIIDKGLASEEQVTVTAVSATTFTATFTKSHAAGFTIDNVNFLIGDHIGLALAGGKAYAAWTGTTGTAGNQDVFFSSFNLSAAALGDRYEPNDTAVTAVNLGSVSAQKVVPQLSLAGQDNDWFKVTAGATGQFVASAAGPALGDAIILELWNSTGTNLVAGVITTSITANGLVIGQQVSVNANANDVFLVRVRGSGVPNYSLSVQAITADLGTSVSGSQDRTIAAGGTDVYRLTTGVGGSLDLSLLPSNTAVGRLSFKVFSADGQTLLASGDIDPAKHETGRINVPVDQGQTVFVQVSSLTAASVLVYNASATIAGGAAVSLPIPTSAPGVRFLTINSTPTATLQAAGNTPVNVNITYFNTAGTPVSSTINGVTAVVQSVVLQPNTPLVLTSLPPSGGFLLQATGSAGSGAYHLEFTNKDIFESSQKSVFLNAPATPSSVVARDVNGDGRPDLILTSSQGTDQVQVMLANTDGTFQAPRAFAVGSGQEAISAREPLIANVNGDAFLDIIVPNFDSADVSVLLGNADGTFAPQRRFDALYQANAVAAGDFDGDTNLDLAVLNRSSTSVRVAILQGRGDGTFAPPTIVNVPNLPLGDASALRVGRVNGDTKDDLVIFGLNDAKFQVMLNDGNGGFTAGGSFSSGEVMFDAQLHDLDGDGRLDAIMGGGNTGSVIVRMNDGNGNFNAAQIYATVPNVPGDNALVAGLVIADFGGPGGPGVADTNLDVVVTTRYRKGSDAPALFMLAGGPGGTLGAAQKIATLKEAGRITVADFNDDDVMDIAMTETGGVRVVYGQAPTIAANQTLATARDLGTVVHYLGQTQAIVPGFTDAYYKLTVPTEAANGAGDQVIDFSALFQYAQGNGLSMEVLNADGTQVLGTGARFRITAAQGSVLIVHVFANPAGGGQPAGAGAYTLGINVLPQVVSVQPASLGGLATSLVITFQGDRLDAALAEDPNNYVVTNLNTGAVIPVQAPGGIKPVVYNPGANVDVSSGRTFMTAVRQTVTLLFEQALDAGTYRVELKNLKSAAFNAGEASLLAPGFAGHALVDVNGGTISETVTADVTVAATAVFDGSATAFLTQLTNDLSAELDSLLRQFGDDPVITAALTAQVLARFLPAWQISGQNVPFLVIWLDPVSIRMADPNSNRTVFNQQTNVVQNNIGRTYVEVGGNVEVIVTAAVSGTYSLNVSDVQPTARGGALVFDGANVQVQSLTAAMRSGQTDFGFEFAAPAAAAALVGIPTLTLTALTPPPTLAGTDVLAALSNFIIEQTITTILVTTINNTSASGVETRPTDLMTEIREQVSPFIEVAGEVGRSVGRLIETVIPRGAMDFLFDPLLEMFDQGPLGEFLRNLRGPNPVQQNRAPAAPAAPGAEQPEEEQVLDEGVVIALGDADLQAGIEQEINLVPAKADAQYGSLRGLLFATLVVAGGAYLCVNDGEEERRNRMLGS